MSTSRHCARRSSRRTGHAGFRSPARHWPVDARYPWATVAGCSLYCERCGQEGRAPSPKDGGDNAALEAWLDQHRHADAQRGRPRVLSPAQARAILGPKGKGLSDEELARILADLYELAGLVIDSVQSPQKREH
jgi:hypothetical protein